MSSVTIDVIKKEFIQEITLKRNELSRHLKNAEVNLKKSIQNQLHKEIISKNRENVHQMKEKIDNYENELLQISENDPEMIEQIEERYNERLEKHKKEELDFQKKIKKKIDKKKTEKVVLKTFFKEEKKIRNDIKGLRRNIRYAYRHFCRSEDSLPDYMKRNLKNMPNNKGYIWKSVCYFGLKPEIENEPTFLFEKRYGTLYIHEYTHNEYFYFSKERDGPKVLIKHEKRKPAFPEFTKPVQRQQENRRNNNRRNDNRRNDNRRNNNRRNDNRRNDNRRNDNRRNDNRRNDNRRNDDTRQQSSWSTGKHK